MTEVCYDKLGTGQTRHRAKVREISVRWLEGHGRGKERVGVEVGDEEGKGERSEGKRGKRGGVRGSWKGGRNN